LYPICENQNENQNEKWIQNISQTHLRFLYPICENENENHFWFWFQKWFGEIYRMFL
jgi:hypothetical protein